MKLKCNCCDGIYSSFDIHFTKACDNKCKHCIDQRFYGVGGSVPDVDAIVKTVVENSNGVDDILFLGGEPCLYLEELYQCIREIRKRTPLKVFVTTSVPKTCYDYQELWEKVCIICSGVNLSVQHHNELYADAIRGTVSQYDRQKFYKGMLFKHKIRININLVKPYLSTKDSITQCLNHYDAMGFNSIKLSEIQHGKDFYVSFADLFRIKMKSAYANGCQSYLNMSEIIPGFNTPVLLKRSCFLCESTLKASLSDGLKVLSRLFVTPKNKYGVIYGNGQLEKGWI